MSKFILSILVILFVGGCHTENSTPSTEIIQQGLYEYKAQQTEIGGELFSASPAGGYLLKTFHFFAGDSLKMEVKSDIPEENGVARATYHISDDALNLKIQSSTTSYYKSGKEFVYSDFKVVKDTFTATIGKGKDSYVFQGPGLVLTSSNPDSQDIDNDGSTEETVTQKQYFEYVVKYD